MGDPQEQVYGRRTDVWTLCRLEAVKLCCGAHSASNLDSGIRGWESTEQHTVDDLWDTRASISFESETFTLFILLVNTAASQQFVGGCLRHPPHQQCPRLRCGCRLQAVNNGVTHSDAEAHRAAC